MKFQFCGHVNCPQWFIAQISVLTKITAVKMKLILSQIILHYLQNTDITQRVSKLLNGTGLDIYEMHSVIATLKFILQSSVTFNVSDVVLNKELIDLGLPKQNVQSITKTYKSSRDKLIQKSLQKVLKSNLQSYQSQLLIKQNYSTPFINSYHHPEQVTFSNITLFIGNLKDINLQPIPFAQIELKYRDLITDQQRRQDFIATNQQLDYLIYQLENGLETMEKLEKAEQNKNINEELQ